MSRIHEIAELTVLKTGAFGGDRRHKEATRKLQEDEGSKAGKVSVELFKDHHVATLRKNLASIHAGARKDNEKYSLPGEAGFRIVPVELKHDHTKALALRAQEHKDTVEAIMAEYDDLVATAPTRLGGLWKPQFFPDKECAMADFVFDVNYLPIPSNNRWDGWVDGLAEESIRDVKDRIQLVLVRMVDKLKDPDAIFRDTLVTNIREVCKIAGDLNIYDDQSVSEVIDRCKAEFGAMDPQLLRENRASRDKAAETAASIIGLLA